MTARQIEVTLKLREKNNGLRFITNYMFHIGYEPAPTPSKTIEGGYIFFV